MANKQELKRGPKHPPGYAKNQILLELCMIYKPYGIDQPELNSIIKEKFGISDSKGIRKHLEDLKKAGRLCLKSQKGRENVWYLHKNNLNKVVEVFKEGSEWSSFDPSKPSFHSSKYCQNMINSELLREIEKRWNLETPYPTEETVSNELNKWYIFKESKELPVVREIDNGNAGTTIRSGGLERPYWKYDIFPESSFTEEDVIKILRLSPTALKKALDGSPEEGMSKNSFEEMLISSLILDSSTMLYPGISFKSELSIEVHTSEGIFKKSCGFNTQTIMPDEFM